MKDGNMKDDVYDRTIAIEFLKIWKLVHFGGLGLCGRGILRSVIWRMDKRNEELIKGREIE